MTIDEAISHALEVAERQEYLSTQNHGYCEEKWNVEAREQCAECAADHRQLAEWLTELKDLREENKVLIQECDRLIKEKGELLKKSEQIAEYKRLLRQAVEDINVLLAENDTCYYCKNYVAGECLCVNDCNRTCEWHCIDDALKLLGGSENGLLCKQR